MKSKAAGCGSISTVIFSIVFLCVSSIIIIIIIIMIIIIMIVIIIIIIIIRKTIFLVRGKISGVDSSLKKLARKVLLTA